MNKLLTAALTTTLLLSGQVMAHGDEDEHSNNYSFNSNECSINLNYGVVVEGSQIRFLSDDNTYVQINDQQQLFVQGKQVSLNDKQQQLVSEYAFGINKQVPEIVNLALDATEVAFQAVSHVVSSISGDNAESNDKVNAIFAEIKDKMHSRFNNDNGNYYLAEQNFTEFDEYMEDELEDEIEALVSESVGDILIAVGTAINSEDGSFEEKMAAFGERMERMGEEIEVAVEAKAEALEAQADKLCGNLKDLDVIEQELSDSVAELSSFDLISVTD
ncbi:DUF2884 family protein [Colwelliaceae bacterium BS250]